ncbi:MAG: FG-GAP repeat domain-containing protein [Thermoleophilia bacterium]
MSNDNGFDDYRLWTAGHGFGSAKQMLADVNGDGKADAVVFFNDPSGSIPGGRWYVALSNGNGFDGYTLWKSGFGAGSNSQMLADVNGDGKSEAVAFYNDSDGATPGGRWYVAPSTGSSFGDQKLWVAGHGAGSTSQMLADVDGDGKADAVAFFSGPVGPNPGGEWYVAKSNGNGFDQYALWVAGHGAGSSKQMLADVNGDSKADAVAFSNSGGYWYVALSNGNGFVSPGTVSWKNNFGQDSNWQTVADVKGDKKAAPAAFFYSDGSWKVMPADLDKFSGPNIVNTWEAGFKKPIRYRPLVNGVPSEYDSGDPAVIDEHLKMMEDAQIDYLIFDLTNVIDTNEGYISSRAKAVASRIAIWNASGLHRPIKYVVAIGKMNLVAANGGPVDPQYMEDEAAEVTNCFVVPDSNKCPYGTVAGIGGPDNYYYVDGKPLLISYAEYSWRLTWQNSGIDKTNSNQFTVRWLQGETPNSAAPPSTNPPPSDYGLYYGWGYWSGSLPNPDVMVVMPGWNNQHGGYDYVSRYTTTSGSPVYNYWNWGASSPLRYFYNDLSWQRVLATKPNTVVINSFNEFAEETAVEPSDTSQVYNAGDQYKTESWPTPDFFWNMTKQNIQAYRQAMLSDTVPPQGTIAINGGDAVTQSTNVSLNLSASDSGSGVEEMRFRNQNQDWAPWQLYSQTASWTIPAGNSGKDVDVQFRDRAGNISDVFSASIQLKAPRDYFWTWYDSKSMQNWILMANPVSATGNLGFDLRIAGNDQILQDIGIGAGKVLPGKTLTSINPGTMGGPVRVTSETGDKAIVSQRSLMGNSFEEVLGTDAEKLSDHFYWTWYDQQSAGFTNWILIANPSDNETIHAVITFTNVANGQLVTAENDIIPGKNWTPTFPGKMGGPVEVKAYLTGGSWPTDKRNVIASQRVLSNYGTAFNEVPGIPAGDLASDYLWTWYDMQSAGMTDWVLVANPSDTPVSYQIKIGGVPQPCGNCTIPAHDKVTPIFPRIMNGPVEVIASGNVIASQRVVAGPSFEKVPGYPQTALANDYHWTWYDMKSPGSANWILVANPGDSDVTYQIKISGVPQPCGDCKVSAHGKVTPVFPGTMSGPVEVITSGNVMASQRVLWNGYFNEVLGTVLN